jgi:N-acetylmuramic acid 6-phosphate etherase
VREPVNASLPPTEQRNPASGRLGELAPADVVGLMADADQRVLAAVAAATPELARTAEQVAAALRGNFQTILIGAGTSGWIAVQEVAELGPTFGVPAGRFRALVACGELMGASAITANEDDALAVTQALHRAGIGPGDVVIGVAASGSTPFVRAGVQAAARAGAWSCGIANNPGAALLQDGALGILLDTGPEVLTGSTRLKAGTAQKLALNRIMTAAMVLAGRVASNHMIDLTGSTAKLRDRAVRIVMDLAGLSRDQATARLAAARWSVRVALEQDPPD